MYHVIAAPPAGAPFPGLYVAPTEFAEQMHALAADGWHAVTLDQVAANWREGTPLGPGKPIVLSFDNGYHSQYSQALPVLRSLGWVGDENIQLTGLPPSQGGLSSSEVRGLLAAGWELDTQGLNHADLTTLDAASLREQVQGTREILRRRYGVPVNWFCYPSGHYDAGRGRSGEGGRLRGLDDRGPGVGPPRRRRLPDAPPEGARGNQRWAAAGTDRGHPLEPARAGLLWDLGDPSGGARRVDRRRPAVGCSSVARR